MSSSRSDKRTSVSLFPNDDVLLASQVLQLAARGVEISPNRYIRALAHLLTEREMGERALKQAKAEREHPPAVQHTARRPIIYLLADDVAKLKRVRLGLLAKQVRYGETEILRALWYHPLPMNRLAKQVGKFLVEYPDGRSQGGREKAGR